MNYSHLKVNKSKHQDTLNMILSKLSFLIEARKNPKSNPRISTTNEILKYRGQDDIFVSFGSINKVGINPSSTYNTPNGFYTYPVNFLIQQYDESSHKLLAHIRSFPKQKHRFDNPEDFGSEYAFFVKLINKENVWDVTDNIPVNKISQYKMILGTTEQIKTFGDMWKIACPKAGDNSDHSTKITSDRARKSLSLFRQMGIDGITDLHGTSTIHPYEPTQAVFFNVRCLKQLDTLKDTTDWLIDGCEYGDINANTSVEEFNDIIASINEKYEDEYYEENLYTVHISKIGKGILQWIISNAYTHDLSEWYTTQLSVIYPSMVQPIITEKVMLKAICQSYKQHSASEQEWETLFNNFKSGYMFDCRNKTFEQFKNEIKAL